MSEETGAPAPHPPSPSFPLSIDVYKRKRKDNQKRFDQPDLPMVLTIAKKRIFLNTRRGKNAF